MFIVVKFHIFLFLTTD